MRRPFEKKRRMNRRMVVFSLPFIPIFFAASSVLHPLFGAIGVAIVVLVLLVCWENRIIAV